jgi:hypothetical protein
MDGVNDATRGPVNARKTQSARTNLLLHIVVERDGDRLLVRYDSAICQLFLTKGVEGADELCCEGNTVVVPLIVVELSVRYVLARESATQEALLCGGCVRMKLRRKTYVRHQPIKTLLADLVRLGMGHPCVTDTTVTPTRTEQPTFGLQVVVSRSGFLFVSDCELNLIRTLYRPPYSN